MLYQLTGFSGRSNVVGQLREFDFKDGVLSIKDLTLQDARNVLSVLATGEVGSPITYGGILKEIANPPAAGIVVNSQLEREPLLSKPVETAEAVQVQPIVTPEVTVEPEPAQEPKVKQPKTKKAAATLNGRTTAVSEDDDIKPPPGTKLIDLAAAAKGDWVTSDLPPVTKQFVDEPANVLQCEPGNTSATRMFDPDDIPTWVTGAKAMRKLAMDFHTAWGVPYNESGVAWMFAACQAIQDKVPLFKNPHLRDRLAAAVETLHDD